MNYVNEDIVVRNRISITNQLQEIGIEEVRKEIIEGLLAEQKSISSKYFYNQAGSLLFEKITRLEEYYPTRTEKTILKAIAPGLMEQYGTYDIVELGPGDHSKISILLRAAESLGMNSMHYLPMDISQPALHSSAEMLVDLFPRLQVEAYALDFITQFDVVQRKRPALICFFGSTIGNFEWEDSLNLLQNISSSMKKDDVLLLGMDLVKPEEVLHAAYNDAEGVTEAFNLNILNNVNDLIHSDFDPKDFEHLAFYNKEHSRIEMHLVARKELSIRSPFSPQEILIGKGEHIHTENSHKYDRVHIRKIVEATGLRLVHTHTDERNWFALTEFVKG